MEFRHNGNGENIAWHSSSADPGKQTRLLFNTPRRGQGFEVCSGNSLWLAVNTWRNPVFDNFTFLKPFNPVDGNPTDISDNVPKFVAQNKQYQYYLICPTLAY
jgi:hypothetical protein